MASKLSIRDFGIDVRTIPPEIAVLHNSLAKARITKLKKNYESAYDFLVILFHSIFVEGLQVRAVAARLHLRPVNVHIHLYNFGWHYSPDYVENQQLFRQAVAEARDYLLEAREESSLLQESEHPKLQKALRKVKKLHNKSFTALGFETEEEYVRVLYYLLECVEMSPIILGQALNLPYHNLHQRIKVLGLNISHKDSMIRKKKYERQDYVQSINSGNITKTQDQLKHYSQGSMNEIYFRSQLAKMIYSYIARKKSEAIIGLNNTGIIRREIDIPLVIYDVEKNVIHRFAIEYNGNYWHSKKRDTEKQIMCESKGWHYLEVIEPRIANTPELLHPILHETCNKIKLLIGESDVASKSLEN